MIIDGWNSPVTLAMQPVIARANILDITAVSKADPILSGEGNPYAIRINSSNGQDGGVIARYIVQTLGAKRIGFLTQNDAYGNGAQAAHRGRSWESSASPTRWSSPRNSRSSRPTSACRWPTSSRPSRTLVVAINAAEASGHARPDPAVPPGRHRRQARRRRRHDPAHGVQGRGRRHRRRHLVRTSTSPTSSRSPRSRRTSHFVEAYRKAHGEAPDKGAALGAPGADVWARAATATKSLDRKTVAEAIRGKTIKGTLFGDVTFEPNGQMQSRHTLFKVVDGKTMKLEVLK